MSCINLLEEHDSRSTRRETEAYCKKNSLNKTHQRLSIGDKITFWAGYNGDIQYLSEIAGIDENGDIHVIWDCYWSPIRDEAKRDIKIVN